MLKRVVKSITKKFLTYSRFVFMLFQFMYMFIPSRKIRIFNLDLHTSPIADLREGFSNYGVCLISWNLSGNNRNFRKFFKIKDPVYPLSNKSWTSFSDSDFQKFRNRYRFFLSRFDAFVVCFPPAFAEIFVSFDKPVLVNIGTRYEAPYTRQQERWNSLNRTLKSGVDSGKITIVSNNQADADYLHHFTGISATVLPSLCDYTKINWTGARKSNVLFCRNTELANKIIAESNGQMVLSKDYLGSNWKYEDLADLNSITVIPYNISTMSIFEYATAGIPVRVPSPSLMLKLCLEYPDILNEVSFLGAWGLDFEQTDDQLLNYLSKETLTWWLERADYYQSNLMPNVQVFESISEISSIFPILKNRVDYIKKIQARNSRLSDNRRKVLAEFLRNVPNFAGKSTKID